jgi:hypothetical protein
MVGHLAGLAFINWQGSNSWHEKEHKIPSGLVRSTPNLYVIGRLKKIARVETLRQSLSQPRVATIGAS